MHDKNCEIQNDYVVDRNGTIYIGLHNYYNSFCYYISSIQCLHSSKKLNTILVDRGLNSFSGGKVDRSEKDEDIIVQKLFSMLRIYADIDETNYGNIYEQLNKENNDLILSVLNEKMKRGGSYIHVITGMFFPILYHYLNKDEFLTILREVKINPLQFLSLSYVQGKDYFQFTQNDTFNNDLEQWYIQMYNDIISNTKIGDDETQFNITPISIWLKNSEGGQSSFPGHAICVVLGHLKNDNKNTLYVIDDDANIMNFGNYLLNAKNSIYQIELKNLSQDVFNVLNAYNRVFKVRKELYNIGEMLINKRIYRTIITIKENTPTNIDNEYVRQIGMSGGVKIEKGEYTNSGQEYKITLTLLDKFLILALIILIIAIIVILVRNKYKNRDTNNKIKKYQSRTDELQTEIESFTKAESPKRDFKALQPQQQNETQQNEPPIEQQTLSTKWIHKIKRPLHVRENVGFDTGNGANYTYVPPQDYKGDNVFTF